MFLANTPVASRSRLCRVVALDPSVPQASTTNSAASLHVPSEYAGRIEVKVYHVVALDLRVSQDSSTDSAACIAEVGTVAS